MLKLTPFSNVPRKRDDFVDFYNVIEDFFNSAPLHSFKIDVEEKEGEYVIFADLPGVKKENIKVSYEDSNLTILIEHEEEVGEEDTKGNFLHKERYKRSMKRTLYLPNLEPSKVQAKIIEGVLKIHAKKTEEQHQSYTIDVE